MKDLNKQLSSSAKFFWSTRESQSARQGRIGPRDAGNRTCVTGGKQMGGFERLIQELLIQAGIPEESIYCSSKRELPGFFRAEKNWDLVVVHQKALIAAMEFKSQVGSFGNN